MNYVPLVMSAFLAASSLGPDELRVGKNEWKTFKVAHNKEYENKGIEQMRRLVYAHNKQLVAQHNAAENETFELGLNDLADMSALEVKQALNGFRGAELKKKIKAGKLKIHHARRIENFTFPEAVDWRKVPGRVSSVRDQGHCGSCWAFAAVGGLEGQEATVANISNFGDADLVELSVQNLLDCDKLDHGCDGGVMDSAYEFIQEQGGIDSRQAYPYEARKRECRFMKFNVAMTDRGAAVLSEGDEDALMRQVAVFGPVPVAIDASQPSFQLYKKGVYKPQRCGNSLDELDHAVLVVGYGSDPQQGDFWIVKNSWGSEWGEQGYIRMARNAGNKCGIASYPVIPLIY